MKTFVPHYYSNFKCIAGECRHSCCIGWEIDIDPLSLKKYNSIKTPFGKKIRDNMDFQDGGACFRLNDDERCPFLNEQKLCDIILNLGEDYLCDICTDHPRFRNFYSDRTETGLGLCCEEACRIILSDSRSFTLISDCENGESLTEDEQDFLCRRDLVFNLVENSDSVFTAIRKINDMYNLNSFEPDLQSAFDFYSALEMLDISWQERLNTLKNSKTAKPDRLAQKAFINLYKYFIFRHTTVDNFFGGLKFAEISVNLIFAICERTDFSFENICEIARMYSSEIEYSDENTDKVTEFAEG